MNGEQTALKVFPVRQILLAGMAGGMAEIVWFGLVGLLLSMNVQDVAAGITASVSPDWGASPYAAFTGVLIHLFLSVALAAVYIATLGRWSISRFGLAGQLLIGMSALVLVWAMNYLVILPVLNPSFIELSTYGLSLPSKALFGITMALTFNYLVAGD